MWVPATGLPLRLAPLALAGAGRFCILRTRATTRGDPPRRGLSDSSPQLLPYPDFGESPPWVCKHRLDPKRYVSSRGLAETLVQILRGSQKDPRSLFLECNPGPGVLTQALLETGAKVVALESDRNFIPRLEINFLGLAVVGAQKTITHITAVWNTKYFEVKDIGSP
uniref:Uncharacterized protein n=1 Tax=Oryctolagus cuniculus TaxID=9986 RepID=A0A5F9CXZ8_RABIT